MSSSSPITIQVVVSRDTGYPPAQDALSTAGHLLLMMQAEPVKFEAYLVSMELTLQFNIEFIFGVMTLTKRYATIYSLIFDAGDTMTPFTCRNAFTLMTFCATQCRAVAKCLAEDGRAWSIVFAILDSYLVHWKLIPCVMLTQMCLLVDVLVRWVPIDIWRHSSMPPLTVSEMGANKDGKPRSPIAACIELAVRALLVIDAKPSCLVDHLFGILLSTLLHPYTRVKDLRKTSFWDDKLLLRLFKRWSLCDSRIEHTSISQFSCEECCMVGHMSMQFLVIGVACNVKKSLRVPREWSKVKTRLSDEQVRMLKCIRRGFADSDELCYALCGRRETSTCRFRRCAACKINRYCSLKCQRANWRSHRPICLAYRRVNNLP